MLFTTAGIANRLECELRRRILRARALGTRDLGASAIEWVIISAVLIIIVGVVAAILVPRIRTAANNLNVNPPVGGNP